MRADPYDQLLDHCCYGVYGSEVTCRHVETIDGLAKEAV